MTNDHVNCPNKLINYEWNEITKKTIDKKNKNIRIYDLTYYRREYRTVWSWAPFTWGKQGNFPPLKTEI